MVVSSLSRWCCVARCSPTTWYITRPAAAKSRSRPRDIAEYLKDLPASPTSLSDLYELRFEDVLAYLVELGTYLDFRQNEYLADAFELSQITSGLTSAVLERIYGQLPSLFNAASIRDMAEQVIGIDYLNGWVPTELSNGKRFSLRAFGPRLINILSGNVPTAAASAFIRSLVVRSDVIMKAPSNDPATAVAIARTMCDIAPDHPLTRHVSVAYWKGGDSNIEDVLYDPSRIEKIYATGGEASMRHIRRYLRPGIDLVAADPKLSATFIGRGALQSEELLHEVAQRLALDVGIFNQEACVSARSVYVESGTDQSGLDVLRRLGHLLYRAILDLPVELSSPVEYFDPELRDAVNSIRLSDEWYEVIGVTANEGGVIVSLLDDTVDFSNMLSGRVANLVPVDSIEGALRFVNGYTQTVGVYPPELKAVLRDRMAVFGAQRIVTLGQAAVTSFASPVDGIEPLRRLAKWVVDEEGED